VKVEIRPAVQEDYDALCAVVEEVDALHRERLPHLFREPGDRAREREYLFGLMADETVGLLVAEVDGQLAGTVVVGLYDTPPVPILVPRRYAVVDNLVVKREYRRAGVGRVLMEEAQQWAAARGATSIELSVYAFNEPALAFYRGLGYEILRYRMTRPL
jgi:ribosomal protein S18 acetylase RimI-like enzyme